MSGLSDDDYRSLELTTSGVDSEMEDMSANEHWPQVGAGACFVDRPEVGDDNAEEDKKDLMSEHPSCDNIASTFLTMPLLVRENIYLHLTQKDHLRLRHVCSQLSYEIDTFVEFIVTFRKPLTRSFVPIPFPHLKFLTIDNCNADLPWHWTRPISQKTNPRDQPSTHTTQEEEYIFEGTIAGVKLMSVTENTLKRLSFCRSIKGAIIATDVFERKIPQLHWLNLTYLRLHFYIVRFVGSHELEMLENFDSLCKQIFPKLVSLKICLRRSYLNPQSSFSIRALRFMAKHWRTLKDMTIEMEAEKCDLYPQTSTPEFTEEELDNLSKVQLNSLKIDATEMMCRKCRIWQDFIKQQKAIESLKVSLYAAQGHPVFFYPCGRSPKASMMKTISIGLWGLHGHYPIDFRRLTNGLSIVHNIRLFRSPSIVTESQDGPELVNVNYVPQGLVSLTLKGFIISGDDIEVLLKNTPELTHLTLKNAGSLPTMGMHLRHVRLVQNHPSLATACVDFNNPVNCPDQSYEMFMREMEQGRMEHKVIGSRDRLHTFLLIDRIRTSVLMRQKEKLHDDEVLPGLDYPTGFINRFDNWKIRN